MHKLKTVLPFEAYLCLFVIHWFISCLLVARKFLFLRLLYLYLEFTFYG